MSQYGFSSMIYDNFYGFSSMIYDDLYDDLQFLKIEIFPSYVKLPEGKWCEWIPWKMW